MELKKARYVLIATHMMKLNGTSFMKVIPPIFLKIQLFTKCNFHGELSLPALTPQTALFGLLDDLINIKQNITHISKRMSQ